MDANAILQLRAARDAVQRAEANLTATWRQMFPVGADVSWRRGGHRQFGVVEAHGYRDSLVARNRRTGKRVKISSYEILEAHHAATTRPA